MRKDFRTPLGKSIGLGAAHSGTKHFIMQRLTALANVPLFVFFIILIICVVGKDYHSVQHILANPVVAVILALMLLSGIYHMMIGMQVIIEDYFPQHLARIWLLSLNVFFCFVMGAACILAILKITLGG